MCAACRATDTATSNPDPGLPPSKTAKLSCTRVNSTYVENYDCGLLQPLYGTHGGAPPSPDMFGVTMQKLWSKMRSSHMICNVLNTVLLVPRLCLDDSTQTKPPACPHGVGGWSPRCRIAWNGLHHPRESILAPIDVLGNLDLKTVWWILVLNVWGND